jgi:hypothetical protein
MRIRATPEVTELIARSGGRLYVWATDHRCCGGRLTTLEAAIERPERPPGPARDFSPISADGFTLFLATGARSPEELVLEAHGRRHSRVRAYWNGCVYAP